MSVFKIVLLSFGSIEREEKNFDDRLLKEPIGALRYHSYEIYQLPEVGERFMVIGPACGDHIFRCHRIDDNKGLDKIEGHDYVVFASFVGRFAFAKPYEQKNLKKFTSAQSEI